MTTEDIAIYIVLIIGVILFIVHPGAFMVLLILVGIISSFFNDKSDTALQEKTEKPTNNRLNYARSVPDTPYGMYMSANDKQIYMQSPEWKLLKDQRLKLANHKCEACGSTSNLHLHHIDYSTLGCENISHIRILCQECHQVQHDYYGYSRSTVYLPIIRG